jgi:hypothetical protein
MRVYAWNRTGTRAAAAACAARAGPPLLTVELTSAILLGLLAARLHPGLPLAAYCHPRSRLKR